MRFVAIKADTAIIHQARSGAGQDLIDFDPRCLDNSLPLLGIGFQKRVTCKLLDESRFGESFGKVATYLLYDLRWRFGRRKNALPRVNHIAGDSRLGDGRHLLAADRLAPVEASTRTCPDREYVNNSPLPK